MFISNLALLCLLFHLPHAPFTPAQNRMQTEALKIMISRVLISRVWVTFSLSRYEFLEPPCPSVDWSIVVFLKGGESHFQTPIGALFYCYDTNYLNLVHKTVILICNGVEPTTIKTTDTNYGKTI